LRPDTWLRPANIEVPLDLPDVVLTRGPMLTGDAAALVASLWPLDELERDARRHTERLAAVSGLLATDHRALVDAFVSLAGAQRFLRTEPQLPESLAPGPAAAELRARYGTVVERFQRRLAEFLGSGREPSPAAVTTSVQA
jgi:DNA-binding transcriptional regulator PaaX